MFLYTQELVKDLEQKTQLHMTGRIGDVRGITQVLLASSAFGHTLNACQLVRSFPKSSFPQALVPRHLVGLVTSVYLFGGTIKSCFWLVYRMRIGVTVGTAPRGGIGFGVIRLGGEIASKTSFHFRAGC